MGYLFSTLTERDNGNHPYLSTANCAHREDQGKWLLKETYLVPIGADLNSFEMWQVLLNLVTQLCGNQEDGAVVLHHESHKFGGEELIQVYLIFRTQNAVREHLHHLDRHGTGLNPGRAQAERLHLRSRLGKAVPACVCWWSRWVEAAVGSDTPGPWGAAEAGGVSCWVEAAGDSWPAEPRWLPPGPAADLRRVKREAS